MILYEGVFTALITPFKNDGSLNVDGFLQNIQDQADAHVHGLILFGSTGEGSNLLPEEIEILGKAAVDAFKGKIPLIFGASHCSTKQSVANSLQAEKLGADGIILTPPYYLKPTQEGIYQHYKAVADSVALPVFLYNHPFRTNVHIETQTVQRLTEIPNIAAIKECSNQLEPLMDQTLPVFIGDDKFFLPGMSLGAVGIISALSNLFPHKMVEIFTLCMENDFFAARKIFAELNPFVNALNLETNPIVIKKLMEMYGKPSGSPRLPLTPATAKTEELLRSYGKKPLLC